MSARRGVALVLVLWLVVVLGAIGSAVVLEARASAGLARNANAALVARYAAESGTAAVSAALEDTLAALPYGAERRDWLNGLERASGGADPVALGSGRFAWAVLDVSARLDVNAATAEALTAFFAQFMPLADASAAARAIRRHVEGNRSSEPGAAEASPLSRPIRSLDELREAGLVPPAVLERAAPYLTVDGDGTINRRAAPDTVLVAAAGELRDEPTRLLVVSRGWMAGHPLTHEIQAVYDVSVDRLVLVGWRERVR